MLTFHNVIITIYKQQLKQQQFYSPLLQDNMGRPAGTRNNQMDTLTRYHHCPPQYLKSVVSIYHKPTHLLSLTSNSSYPLHYFLPCSLWPTSRPNTFNHKIHTFLHRSNSQTLHKSPLIRSRLQRFINLFTYLHTYKM